MSENEQVQATPVVEDDPIEVRKAKRQALLDAGAHNETVNDQINLVLFLLVQDRRVLQLVHFPVDAGADEAALPGVLHQLHVLAFPGADDGG